MSISRNRNESMNSTARQHSFHKSPMHYMLWDLEKFSQVPITTTQPNISKAKSSTTVDMNHPHEDLRSPRNQEHLDCFIHDCIQLFHEYEWVYQFKMPEILFPKNIEKMPTEFVDFFRMCGSDDFLAFQALLQAKSCLEEIPSTWPTKLRSFVRDYLSLRKEGYMCDDFAMAPPPFPAIVPKKWPRKKFEEVSHLSSFVKANCEELNCDAIVDIGSGLGYLSGNLADQCGIPVIAVESKQQMVTSASEPETNKAVKFVNLELDKNISSQLLPYLSKYSRVCITGLHACGNLTPWSLNLFLSDPRFQSLALVPCCYHKMNQEQYDNIPMSRFLKEEMYRLGDTCFLLLRNEAFCRIASQRSGEMFALNIDRETKHTFYRGLLELYAMQGNIQLQRNRRKGLKGDPGEFSEYLNGTIGPLGKFSLHGKFDSHKENLLQLCSQNRELFKTVKGVIIMQGALQGFAEAVILLDRIKFLLESGKVEANLKRVIPSSISPRGLILAAKKLRANELN